MRTGMISFIIFLLVIMVSMSGLVIDAVPIDSDYLGSSPGRYDSIKCADIDDDGNVEMVFSNYEGHLSIVEATGGAYIDEWHSGSIGHRIWGLELADVDDDGTIEIIAGGQAGHGGEGFLGIWDGRTHELEWKAEGEVETVDGKKVSLVRDLHGIEIGDPDMDGDIEMVVGSGYKTDNPWSYVYVFNGKTHLLEDRIGPVDSRLRGIEIADIDEDGMPEIIFGSGVALGERPGEGYLYIYGYDEVNRSYQLEWTSPDVNGDVQGLVVLDLDEDGHLDIVFTTGYRYREGYVFIARHIPSGEGGVGTPDSYEIVWQSDNIGPKPYGLVVDDMDGDGIMEIVTGNQPGYIWVFDGVTHQVEWKSEILGTDVMGLTIYDIDGDGQKELIAAQGGYIGKADWTSGYSSPHIYIFDGRSHSREAILGEPDYIEILFQALVILLILITLWNLTRFVKRKRDAQDMEKGKVYKDKVSRRRGVR